MTETTTPTPSSESSEPRRLRRSRDDKMIAGVAGGIGEYFAIDPVLVRIGFVALSLLGGAGPILYPLARLLLPGAGGQARGVGGMPRLRAVVARAPAGPPRPGPAPRAGG